MGANVMHGYLNFLHLSTYQEICASWESYKGYTVRPVASTERYYLSVLERFASPEIRVLVYGGTPEIRNCILKVGAKATIMDRSVIMVEAMGLLTLGKCPINENEDFIEADWCDIPLGEAYADMAMGDDAINMVDWEKFELFLKNTHRILKPDGLFACHLIVQPDAAYRAQSVSDVLREYRTGLIKSKYDLASRINFTLYDEQTYKMGWQRSIEELRRLLSKKQIDSDYGFIDQFRHHNGSFACPPKEKWEALACRYFTIEEILYPVEYDYCRFEPLYLLRKQTPEKRE